MLQVLSYELESAIYQQLLHQLCGENLQDLVIMSSEQENCRNDNDNDTAVGGEASRQRSLTAAKEQLEPPRTRSLLTPPHPLVPPCIMGTFSVVEQCSYVEAEDAVVTMTEEQHQTTTMETEFSSSDEGILGEANYEDRQHTPDMDEQSSSLPAVAVVDDIRELAGSHQDNEPQQQQVDTLKNRCPHLNRLELQGGLPIRLFLGGGGGCHSPASQDHASTADTFMRPPGSGSDSDSGSQPQPQPHGLKEKANARDHAQWLKHDSFIPPWCDLSTSQSIEELKLVVDVNTIGGWEDDNSPARMQLKSLAPSDFNGGGAP
jgi:hypothetical protein